MGVNETKPGDHGVELLRGRIQAGKGDASRWLLKFNEAYARKLGMPVYPGSLNLALPETFDWFAPRYAPFVIPFPMAEYGGERDLLLMPCVLRSLDRRRAFLWSTVNAARSREDPWVVEVIAAERLRGLGVEDGDVVEVEVRTSSLSGQAIT